MFSISVFHFGIGIAPHDTVAPAHLCYGMIIKRMIFFMPLSIKFKSISVVFCPVIYLIPYFYGNFVLAYGITA